MTQENPQGYLKYVLIGVSVLGLSYLLPKYVFKKPFQQISQVNQQKKVKQFDPIFEWSHFEQQFSKEEQIYINQENILQIAKKISKIRQQGLENVQFVMDFDQTITPFNNNGEMSPPTFRTFKAPSIPIELQQEMQTIFEKYFPYEHCTKISQKEKEFYLNEWKIKKEEAISKYHLTHEQFQKAVDHQNYAIRNSFSSLFKNLKNLNVPFYIVSGGVNGFIFSILNSITDINSYGNLFIHSCEMIMNHKGKLIDFQMLVNTSTKFENLSLKNYPEGFKKNVILLGDSHNDITMSKSMECKNILNILFLKENTEEKRKQAYEIGWDIIITQEDVMQGQSGFIFVLELLKLIVKNEYLLEIEDSHQQNLEKHQNYQEIKDLFKKSLYYQ